MRACGHCHIGHLRRTHTTYMNWHSGLFITVPNMPVWLCDVCAHCEIDADAINHLMPLLGPVTRPDPTQPRRARHPLVGDTARPEFDSDRGQV